MPSEEELRAQIPPGSKYPYDLGFLPTMARLIRAHERTAETGEALRKRKEGWGVPTEVKTPAEQLLYSTIRIETSNGDEAGTATGFVFKYDLQKTTVPFLVSNRHVVADATSVRFFFTKSDGTDPLVGQRLDVELQALQSHWHGHPQADVDIAILPLGPILNKFEREGTQVFFAAIDRTLVPTSEQLKGLDAIEEVLFIGYPNGLFDTENLVPISRRGTTATPPQIDYEGRPVFLIDASVFPGSSGSPVFICNTGGYATRGGFVVGSRVLFLGVVAEVAFREEHGKIDFVSVPTAKVPVVTSREMIDLGVVYKASTVIETAEDLLRSRKLL